MQSGIGTVVSELNQVHELARELSESLDSSNMEICRALARQLICSMEKVISTAKASLAGEEVVVFSNVGELQVERFNQKFIEKEQKISKRRKTLANRTSRVSVSTEEGTEVPPEDGHSWRKYGQKDILGAKYPRSYYRCTHRKTQECLAMKQVQKSDENSSVFDITYLGTHTCFNLPQNSSTTSRPHNQQNSLVLHLDFKTNLKVRSECLEIENQDPISSFSFPSTPIEGMNQENALFCSSRRLEYGYGEILSSELMSPTRYGSNCFSWPPCDMNSQADSGLTEILSAANSVTDLSVMDVDFMLENGELMDTDISFDTSIFFE